MLNRSLLWEIIQCCNFSFKQKLSPAAVGSGLDIQEYSNFGISNNQQYLDRVNQPRLNEEKRNKYTVGGPDYIGKGGKVPIFFQISAHHHLGNGRFARQQPFNALQAIKTQAF